MLDGSIYSFIKKKDSLIMIKNGTIKRIGEPREFVTREGETLYAYPVTVAIPYVRQDGKTGEDEMVCDHVAGNPDYIRQVEGLAERGVECELTISFCTREHNGRVFNSVRLLNIAQRISA